MFLSVALALAVLNVLAIAVTRGYDIHPLGLTFAAHALFKPLLVLNGILLLVLVAKPDRRPAPASTFLARIHPGVFWSAFVVLITAACLPTLSVNYAHHDWTHRHISAGLTSLDAVGRLFTQPQGDGMYRPLTFLSLWLDYRVFGDALWGYHLQSIAIHILNAALLAAVATSFGFELSIARLAALVFGLAAVNYEAVLWPAARFDLLQTTFALLTLYLFMRHRLTSRVVSLPGILCLASFAAAVLNKETGYSLLFVIPVVTWAFTGMPKRRALPFFAAMCLTAAALLIVRYNVYGGLGGYTTSAGQSLHFTISLKAIYLLIANSLALTPFGINSVPLTAACCAIAALYALTVYFLRADEAHPLHILLLLAVLSALPALNVIGWINPSLQHTRQLYWPSVWISILLAAALWHSTRQPSRRWIAPLFLVAQLLAFEYNIVHYPPLSPIQSITSWHLLQP
jgi:hypothetical protein